MLAGDAAHVMSPIGGQGMNTGFADAEHLSDVLARILRRGVPPERLLPAYTQFRRRAFRTAAARAASGMWLGTRTGRIRFQGPQVARPRRPVAAACPATTGPLVCHVNRPQGHA